MKEGKGKGSFTEKGWSLMIGKMKIKKNNSRKKGWLVYDIFLLLSSID